MQAIILFWVNKKHSLVKKSLKHVLLGTLSLLSDLTVLEQKFIFNPKDQFAWNQLVFYINGWELHKWWAEGEAGLLFWK